MQTRQTESDHDGDGRTLNVAYFATQGDGSGDEARITALLAPLRASRLELRPRPGRRARASTVLKRLLRERPDVVVMEGTGVAGGAAVLAARLLAGVPYVVSSGDAVGPYLGLISPWLTAPGRVYERLLCRLSAGYIGWSPYLVGRAITLGARRGVTAAHWSRDVLSEAAAPRAASRRPAAARDPGRRPGRGACRFAEVEPAALVHVRSRARRSGPPHLAAGPADPDRRQR